jgi:hypothetical protein
MTNCWHRFAHFGEASVVIFNSLYVALDLHNRRKEQFMLKLLRVICVCLVTLPALAQSEANYQVATIVDVKTHQNPENGVADAGRYDVFLKVGDMIYVVLYTPPFGIDTVKYKTGRSLLVLVGKSAVTYNDLLGQSWDVPIISQKPAAVTNDSK